MEQEILPAAAWLVPCSGCNCSRGTLFNVVTLTTPWPEESICCILYVSVCLSVCLCPKSLHTVHSKVGTQDGGGKINNDFRIYFIVGLETKIYYKFFFFR